MLVLAELDSSSITVEVHLQCLAKVFIPQSNLTELELFCKEEWAKMSVCTCAKLVETNHKRLETVIAAKGGSTKY